jgi:hypothetical protein
VRGKFYRPVKQQVTLRIDADVLAWFKARGGKYQSAIHATLRAHVGREMKGRREPRSCLYTLLLGANCCHR